MSKAANNNVRCRLYSAEELQPLVSPKSIALVGVSSSGKGFGASALLQLQKAKVSRPIYVVHPRFLTEGAPVGAIGVASFADLPEAVDCVLIALPAPAVAAAVREAAERGCKSAIIFSSGFGEIEGGDDAEQELAEIAKATGIKLGGPNTAGVLNYHENLPLTFVPDLSMELSAGNLAIVSQSAGLATHLGHRRHRGLGVSYTITTGNSVDITALDYVNFLLDDPRTDVVLLVLEGLENPQGLAEIGRKSREMRKPVLAVKTGRTQQGGRAAISHTGSLAGSYEVFQAAAEDAGILLFKTTEELIEAGQLFARWANKLYIPGGVGVLTTMGGPGVMAADCADDYGINLPRPTPRTLEGLGKLIPPFAAMGNPIDTSASPTDDVLRQCIEVLAKDEGFSAVLMLAASQTGPSTAQRPAAIAQAVRNSEKPIAAVWLSSWLECPGSEVLDAEPNLPVFRSSDRCMMAIAKWMAWHEGLRTAKNSDSLMRKRVDLSPQEEKQLAAVLQAEESVHGPLSESRSRDVISTLGIRVPSAVVVTSREEAMSIAAKFGFPVVAKIVSPDVPHKAAAGGVWINLANEREVAEAYDRIMRDVRANCPDANLEGVLIAEMVKGGTEFMCGLVRDPVFGSVVLCGAGGSDVEELRDVGRCVTPVTATSAARAVNDVRAFQRLKSKDPQRAALLEVALIEMMQKLDRAAQRYSVIEEVDINPFVLADKDNTLVALDALVVLA